MEDWEEKFSSTYSRPYWRHRTTKETTWVDPSHTTAATAEGEWEELYSQKYQRSYWRNRCAPIVLPTLCRKS